MLIYKTKSLLPAMLVSEACICSISMRVLVLLLQYCYTNVAAQSLLLRSAVWERLYRYKVYVVQLSLVKADTVKPDFRLMRTDSDRPKIYTSHFYTG